MIRTCKTLLLASILSISIAPIAISAEKQAVLAGGCFWCIEKDFEYVRGVTDVISGYTGGSNANPTYKNHTKYGHREVVRITYDDSKISYGELLEIFWRTVDPTDGGGQFCDRGHSYTTAVYALDAEQLEVAKSSKKQAEAALGIPFATELALAQKFTPSEEYHQDYYKKNPARYKYYRFACGRDKAVKKLWGKAAYKGVDKSS